MPVSYGCPSSYLNSSDLESDDVLKDADAIAVYGSQDANTAGLITTKKEMNKDVLNSQMIGDFKKGDERIFKRVFEHYYPVLLTFAIKFTGSREEAEDITLRAFQLLFGRCQAFNTEINIKAFLYICVRNASLNYLKAKQKEKEEMRNYTHLMSDDDFLEYEPGIKQGVTAAVRKAVEELPEKCRKVFKMLYYEERTPGEISDLLNITVSTVYNQRLRALSALRIKLSEIVME